MLGVFVYRLVWIALWALRHIWWNWTISGQAHLQPRGQAMILAVNHLHWTDTCVLGASLPLSLQPTWLAKAELFVHPVAAWWLRAIQVIPVSRGRHGLSALVAAEEALKGGAALGDAQRVPDCADRDLGHRGWAARYLPAQAYPCPYRRTLRCFHSRLQD